MENGGYKLISWRIVGGAGTENTGRDPHQRRGIGTMRKCFRIWGYSPPRAIFCGGRKADCSGFCTMTQGVPANWNSQGHGQTGRVFHPREKRNRDHFFRCSWQTLMVQPMEFVDGMRYGRQPIEEFWIPDFIAIVILLFVRQPRALAHSERAVDKRPIREMQQI